MKIKFENTDNLSKAELCDWKRRIRKIRHGENLVFDAITGVIDPTNKYSLYAICGVVAYLGFSYMQTPFTDIKDVLADISFLVFMRGGWEWAFQQVTYHNLSKVEKMGLCLCTLTRILDTPDLPKSFADFYGQQYKENAEKMAKLLLEKLEEKPELLQHEFIVHGFMTKRTMDVLNELMGKQGLPEEDALGFQALSSKIRFKLDHAERQKMFSKWSKMQ